MINFSWNIVINKEKGLIRRWKELQGLIEIQEPNSCTPLCSPKCSNIVCQLFCWFWNDHLLNHFIFLSRIWFLLVIFIWLKWGIIRHLFVLTLDKCYHFWIYCVTVIMLNHSKSNFQTFVIWWKYFYEFVTKYFTVDILLWKK